MATTKQQAAIAAAVALLTAHGWREDGVTETKAIPTRTQRHPGGEMVIIHGRPRYHLPRTEWYVTVGPRKVCFYAKHERAHAVTFGERPRTTALDEIARFMGMISDWNGLDWETGRA